MKKFLVAMGLAALAFVGCDDSSSASAGPNDEPGVESSSSVEQGSSSSKKAKSSSSVSQSDAKQSSSSEKTGVSSSSVDGASSSSVKSESSSSVENSQSNSGVMTSSSSATSSSSVEEPKSNSSEIESSSSSSEGSEPVERSSSSSLGDVNCSVLLEGETGWSWNVPKECRFNFEITYGTMTDERDGKTYKTVKIGDQTWMAENLNFDPGQGGSGNAKYDWSWCYGNDQNNDPKRCDVTGRVYTWAAAMDSVTTGCGCGNMCSSTKPVRGICPTGWHLPSYDEWNALFKAVADSSTAGKVLKSQTGWKNDGNGTDGFGFSALPAGYRDREGICWGIGGYALFWSSSEHSVYSAYRIGLKFDYDKVFLEYRNKQEVFSVRCLKD